MKNLVTLCLLASTLVACERLVPMTPKANEVTTGGDCTHYKFPMYFLPSFHVDMRNACVSKDIPEAYRRADNWPQKG